MTNLSRRAISLAVLTSLFAAHCAAPITTHEEEAAASSNEDALTQTGNVQKVSVATAKVRAAETAGAKAASPALQAFAKEVTAQKGDGDGAASLLAQVLDGTTLTASLRSELARELQVRHGKQISAALAARGDAALAASTSNALAALGGTDMGARAKAAADLGGLLAARGVLDKTVATQLSGLAAQLTSTRSRFGELIVADATAAILASLVTSSVALPDGKAIALIIPVIVGALVLFGLLIFFPATGVIDYCTQTTESVTHGDWWATWPGTARPDSRVTRVESLSPPRIGAHSEVDDSGELQPSTCITGSFDTAEARLPQIEVNLSSITAVAHAHAVGANYARARNDWTITLRDVSGTSHCARDWNVDEAVSSAATSRSDVDASGWPSSSVLSCSLDHDLPAGRYHVMVCTRAATYTSGGSAWATSRADIGTSNFRRCPLRFGSPSRRGTSAPVALRCRGLDTRPMSVPRPRAVADGVGAGRALTVLAFGRGVSVAAALRPGESLVIGRDGLADLCAPHASVSRRHALLRHDGQVTIEDLGSKNGTGVGERRLTVGEPVPLPLGVLARVGEVSIVVQGPELSRPQPPIAQRPHVDRRDHEFLIHGFLEESAPLVDQLAASSLSVLLLGETGVGKDALAEHLHARSPRRDKPLLRLHCAALSETLLESELFGHEKGAFTGASRRRVGLLESADGGTVFIDEVGELPKPVQVKLLRVLEDRRVTRVGGSTPTQVDVRFLAATHRDLAHEIDAGTFREDLYFRLSGATLHLPPLRERTGEILPLATAFLDRASGGTRSLGDNAGRRLLAHRWPGNIRELRNLMQRAAALSDGPIVHAADLPFDGPPEPDGGEPARIREALRASSGNQTRAAALLGMSRRTLVNRLDALGFPRPRK